MSVNVAEKIARTERVSTCTAGYREYGQLPLNAGGMVGKTMALDKAD